MKKKKKYNSWSLRVQQCAKCVFVTVGFFQILDIYQLSPLVSSLQLFRCNQCCLKTFGPHVLLLLQPCPFFSKIFWGHFCLHSTVLLYNHRVESFGDRRIVSFNFNVYCAEPGLIHVICTLTTNLSGSPITATCEIDSPRIASFCRAGLICKVFSLKATNSRNTE